MYAFGVIGFLRVRQAPPFTASGARHHGGREHHSRSHTARVPVFFVCLTTQFACTEEGKGTNEPSDNPLLGSAALI